MVSGSCLSLGQYTRVTNTALYATYMIQTNIGRGTAFSIDVDEREYWITAKHLFTGVETGPAGIYASKTATASLLSQLGEGEQGHDQHWITETFAVLDPGKDIDILVLVPSRTLRSYHASLNADAGGAAFGWDCEFLGFPNLGGWKIKDAGNAGQWTWFPYIKHCNVSALTNDGNLSIFVLDGINNPGFSGGPVLFGTGPDQKVIAVISGFYQDVLEVLPTTSSDRKTTGNVPPPPKLPSGKGKQSVKQIVKANSGFIVAFNIQPAIEAIRGNPIGPLRRSN
jgi:hypothetical protein